MRKRVDSVGKDSKDSKDSGSAVEFFRDVARRRNCKFEENLLKDIGDTDEEFERKLNRTTTETNVSNLNSTESSISVEQRRDIRASALKRASNDLQTILNALSTVLNADS